MNKVTATTDALGLTTTYSYDRMGNLLQTVEQLNGQADRVTTYAYDTMGRLTKVTDPLAGVTEACYDENGNVKRVTDANGGTTSYTYDAENIRIKAETAEYVEEYVTDTVSAVLSRVLTMTVYKKQDGVAEANGVTTTYFHGQGLISEEREGNYRYYHYNNLGSTMKLTDGEGQIVESYTYGVYGELLSGDSALTHFLYNGRCGVSTDANGLYYMRQRYYNPEIKRFINQDILTGSLSNSQSLNRYSYVQGNPVSYTDPFGLSPVNGLFSNSNNIHGALTMACFTPGPRGAIADLLDTFVYLLEGDIGGAIGAGIAIFASGLGLAYKTVKAVGKADKVSDTAKLVKNTVNAFSESGSFMKAATNGADAAQTLKAVKQGRVVDKLKDAKTAIKNKFNAKNISKLDLDDQVQGGYKGGTETGLSFLDKLKIKITKKIDINRISYNPLDDVFNRGFVPESVSYHRKYYAEYGHFDTSAEPIVVYDLGNGNYMMQGGHHRLRAAHDLKLKTIRVDVIIPYAESQRLGITDLPINQIPNK